VILNHLTEVARIFVVQFGENLRCPSSPVRLPNPESDLPSFQVTLQLALFDSDIRKSDPSPPLSGRFDELISLVVGLGVCAKRRCFRP
jgi:hypothetical protein